MSEDFMSLRTQFFPKSTWECWGPGIFSFSEKKNKVWRPQLSWFEVYFEVPVSILWVWITGDRMSSERDVTRMDRVTIKGKVGTMEYWGVWPTVCRASGPGQMEAQGCPFTALWAGWSPHLSPLSTLTPQQALGLRFTVCPSIGGHQCAHSVPMCIPVHSLTAYSCLPNTENLHPRKMGRLCAWVKYDVCVCMCV